MFDTDIKIDTKELNQALAKVPKISSRTVKEIVVYNARRLLKRIAWLTRKADRAAVPKNKRHKLGHARAGWFSSWTGLELPGKAYSSAAAVRRFAKEGEFKQDFSGSNNFVEMTNNVSFIKKLPGLEQNIQSAVDKQEKSTAKYADRKLNNQIGKLF